MIASAKFFEERRKQFFAVRFQNAAQFQRCAESSDPLNPFASAAARGFVERAVHEPAEALR
jgi:hypothetical protein